MDFSIDQLGLKQNHDILESNHVNIEEVTRSCEYLEGLSLIYLYITTIC